MSFVVSDLTAHRFNASRLLFDLKLCGELIQRLSANLEIGPISACITDGLVEQFGCAFARIWIVNETHTALKLMASSGLYTHLDGSFATVKMGAFKVGKIAQHRIPFLSNQLSEEPWVKDRDWAIANQIQGFAGLPLLDQGEAIGVLAVFSQQPLSDEFLEVLQLLSVATAGAIATALKHQQLMEQLAPAEVPTLPVLSEQLGGLLGHQRLSLIGTEKPLAPAVQQLLLQVVQPLQGMTEHYCRLIYESETVSLEVIISPAGKRLPWEVKGDGDGDGNGFAAIAQQIKQAQGELTTETDGTISKLLVQLPKTPAMAEKPVSGLSEREQEVIELLAQGCRDREVAERLYISERTVKFHVKNILAKLAVRTRVQAVYLAMQRGWLK